MKNFIDLPVPEVPLVHSSRKKIALAAVSAIALSKLTKLSRSCIEVEAPEFTIVHALLRRL